MAPSRRKGANKAAAAAAARRKWKVGDLVLAKVKGFPAWPATVSEAERWGYPADWKKVVVFFFGTEQIAFCNPADVEEFTEDKKVSLLGKRHGADFVRAVNEIIDCFEKLKKQDHVGGASGTDNTNIINENNSDECVKDVAPVVADKPRSAGSANDLNSLTEAAVAAAAEDALHDEEMRLGQASSNIGVTKTPVSTTYLAKSKTEGGRSQNSGSLRRKSSRRLSSSRNDTSRPRSTILPSINNTRSSRRLSVNDRSLRRSRRIVKSSDDSEEQDADSLAFVSNESIADSDSEMMTVNSDMPSVNNGIRMGSKPVGVEVPFSENNEGGTDLGDRLDLQTSNIIIKKKRRPNRKRHTNDVVETVKHDIVASDAEVLKNEHVSPSFSEKSVERYAKDDGDEHLPLVKRARVRMGQSSPAAEGVTLLHKEEKIVEVPESLSMPSFDSLSCKVDAPEDAESVPFKKEPALSSLSHVIPVKSPDLCETRKNLVDVEAALPPSKRLHRALEAMSANVAEDCQRVSNCSPAADIPSNGCCPSSSLECSEISMEKKAAIKSESGAAEIFSNRNSPLSASEFCIVSEVGTSGNDANNILVVSNCGNTHSIDSTNPELCRGSFEHAEGADSKHLKLSPLNEVPAGIDAEHHIKQELLNAGEQLVQPHCDTPDLAMFPTDHCKTEHSELNEAAKGSDLCIQLDGAAGGGDETHKMKNLQLPETNQDSSKSELMEEARPESLSSDITCSVAPVKVLNDGHHQSQFHSNSISHEHMDDITISVTHSSSSLTDAPYSVARASPPISSMCNVNALYSNKSLENSNSCSPDVQLHLEKAKLASKSSSKAESLLSFEAIIRSLTRTKESIGRATRIAIDCAKSGFATKVVEILARNLESESSLHKKVDLFFLVDSITQCSRGIKGDGGVYPSAIQALLPRLLLAAAPPGGNFHENQRQCLKVLRVWQERKIIPEPIIRHHIRELDSLCGSYPTMGSNRTLRSERPFDDPIREMEGMLVDEYGSNSSIQLPGFCMPPMLRDEDGGSDSDGESFEAVTPEHNVENFGGEKTMVPAVEKRSHILEDVDGELEMEDVAPCFDVEATSTSNNTEADHTRMSHYPSDNHYGASFTQQQPRDVPPPSAPLSRSSPPPPPPPPRPPHQLLPPVFPPAVHNSISNGPDSKPYSSSQNLNSNLQKSMANQSVFARIKPATREDVHHRVHENKDFEAQLPRQMPASSSVCSFSNRSTSSRSSGRDSNSIQPTDAFNKGFHLPPPHPAPSNQFSYVQEQRVQSRRDIPPPSNPNRFNSRNTENGNFYRDRDRIKFGRRDNIGECWRPPYPSVSGPCYPDDARMNHAPTSYNGPPREPPLHNSKWDYPSRPVNHNHKHFNPYKPPSKGPIPVANRGPNFWRPR